MYLVFVGLYLITMCMGQFIVAPKELCQFNLHDKSLEIVSEPIVITAKSPQLVIAISPCVHFKRVENFSKTQNPKKIRNCNSNSRACVSDSLSNSLINAGDKFIYTEIEEDGSDKENVLMSVNGDKCKNEENYKVIIHFDCRGTRPSYIPPIDDGENLDSCTYHIRMLASYCAPHCVLRISGQLLNVTDLRQLPDMIVPMGDDKQAVLSICRSTPTCNTSNTVVACEMQLSISKTGNNVNETINTSAIGTLNTEKVFWDENNQQIYLRSQVGTKKIDRRITEVRLLCNWNEISKARIIKNTSKMTVFEVESKFGCVKTASKCKVKSSTGMSYNLENLYKSDNWLLLNSSNKISLNICGPLKISKGSLCQKTYSQICDETGDINYGSIMTPVTVTQYEEILTTTIIGGSTINKNQYSTNIKFICTLQNKPPTLINRDNNSLNIIWETTEACPKYIANGKNCKMSNVYFENGLLDLNGLHTAFDRTISLSQRLSLRYNLCGKLTEACNNVSDVSMCLIENGKESILGQENTDVIFINGVMRSYFYNSNDFDAKPNVNVSFICKHNKPVDGAVSVNSIQDKVAYHMTVETPLACYTNVTYSCSLTHDNHIYDLTPLMKNDSNYELSTAQFKLQINICRPVLTNSQSLCALNTLACLTNVTEPSLSNKRYLSFGRHQKILFDKGLSIKYTAGGICLNTLSSYMETTILFTCSENEESGPILIQSNKCNQTISWRTKHACPKKFPVHKRSEADCLIKSADKILYNFTSLRKHTIDIHLENNNFTIIILNICNGQYSLIHEDRATKRSRTAFKTLFTKENTHFLQYILLDNYKININLQCERNLSKEGFELISSSKSNDEKTIDYILSCLEICDKNIIFETATPVVVPDLLPEVNKTSHETLQLPMTVPLPIKSNCSITSSSCNTFALNSLSPVYVQSLKHSYYIDLNSTDNCKSYICRDNIPFDSFINLDCPKYNVDDDIISLNFALMNESKCKDKDLTGINLILKCSDEEKIALVQESDCYVVIHQDSPSICSFSNNILALNVDEDYYRYKLGIVIASSILISIVLVFTVLRYLRKRRQAISPPLCGNFEFTSLVKQD